MPNHYETLGLSKDASETEIKKTYRKLSLEFHPDRNPSPEANSKFQEISGAYEVLSDPEKKKEYDFELEHGPRGPPGFGGGHGGFGFPFGGRPFTHMSSVNEFHDINEIFNMFGMGMGMGMGGPNIRIFHNGIPVIQKPQPIQNQIAISLEQAYSGVQNIRVDFERIIVTEQQIQVTEKDSITVNIPAGIDNDHVIHFAEKGHIIENKVKGDLQFIVKIHEHKDFTRSGMDLHCKRKISLKESLCGFVLEIPHLNGKMLRLSHSGSSHVMKPGDKKLVPQYGMQNDQITGKLIVEFDVEFPEKLSEEQIQKINEIL